MIHTALIPAKAAIAAEFHDEARRARAFVLPYRDGPEMGGHPSLTLRLLARDMYELAADERAEEIQ